MTKIHDLTISKKLKIIQEAENLEIKPLVENKATVKLA
jgi:DNA polymerase III delta prime subunit